MPRRHRQRAGFDAEKAPGIALPKMPEFPEWLANYAAVREQASELWSQSPRESDPVKARKVLEELITNQLMKRVWKVLYEKDRETGLFKYPACLTTASNIAAYLERARILREKGGQRNIHDAELLEFEARWMKLVSKEEYADPMTEQNLAVELLFSRAYRAAFQTKPQTVKDALRKVHDLRGVAKGLRNIEKQLYQLAGRLETIPIHVTKIYADKLTEVAKICVAVAEDCESDATVCEPNVAAAPWLVTRQRGDIERKTFVSMLFVATDELFGTPLYSTIANITNVVFGPQIGALVSNSNYARPITADTVREMVRKRIRRIRPTFGGLLYPKVKARRAELESEMKGSVQSARQQRARRVST
jgi:hypothetical protein